MSYKEKYESYINSFESFLKKYIDSLSSDVEPEILESVKYSLFSGGKRIRPIIMLAMYELCGGNGEEIYNFATAIEMIHTYSLIHDDLPCMDNDFIRRGKPCNHVVYGKNTALLAGDALLTLAFEVASNVGKSFDTEKVLKSINVLSKSAGIKGMISGQCYDLKWNLQFGNKDELLKIYRLKTARLISASAKIGAILGGADDEKVSLAEEFGENVGICFQLVDDIIDKENDNLSLFENHDKLVLDLTEKAKEKLNSIGKNSEFLSRLIDDLMLRKK